MAEKSYTLADVKNDIRSFFTDDAHKLFRYGDPTPDCNKDCPFHKRGLQLLFEESEESPGKGLRLLRGKVVRLPRDVKTPHMGWNTLKILRQAELLDGIDENSYFYFVHSYYPDPVDQKVVAAETTYGVDFTSVLAIGELYATQFHPEKSGEAGALILQNFAGMVKR